MSATDLTSLRAGIRCPHPDWTPEDLVHRASELTPVLRERSARCDAEGRLLEESNDEFVDAGFYRILQPRVFGGYEYGLPTFVRVMAEIARGCPSSGWVLALTGGHAILLSAFFSEEAQVEAYGTDGEFRAPSVPGPRGVKGRRVEGGYVVDGFWDYASGIDISTHWIGGFSVEGSDWIEGSESIEGSGSVEVDGAGSDPDGPPGGSSGDGSEARAPAQPEARVAVFARDQYRIEDNWHVFGMHGTGSRRCIVENVFVPDHLTIVPPRDALNANNSPGRGVHRNPMYRAGRLGSVLLEEMAAVAVGVGKGMLDAYEIETAQKSGLFNPGTPNAELPAFQRHWGEAWALVHMAEATVWKVADDYMEYARQEVEEGIPFSDERDQELQTLESYATKLCADAVDLLFRTAGTSSAQEGTLRQRYYRDMSVINTHAAAQYERLAETLGRLHLRGEAQSTGGAQSSGGAQSAAGGVR